MAVQTSAPGPAVSRLAGPALVGAAVALALGVYGNVHDPTGEALFTLFFTATLNMKAWLATVVLLLAGFQLLSAARLYGKVHIPRQVPPWLGQAHRLSGTLAFLVSLPVAYHCLWSLGFESDPDQTRRFVHSIAGCFFYGAFASKVLVVRSRSLPGWALPAAGGALFTSVVVLWLSSALWFFDTVGFPEF
jgi:Zn-dependent protease